jgi:hypothetical protein
MIFKACHYRKKTVWHEPWEKVLDVEALILAGGTAMNQLEMRIRPDKAVQWAFGHYPCASSSEVQKLLDRSTTVTVEALQKANGCLYQQYGQARQHNFSKGRLVLDVDLTGLITSQYAEGSTKGYFAKKRGTRGRQLCRLLATPYKEVLWQQLVAGNTLSLSMLKAAIAGGQRYLQLSRSQRQQTLLRWDAGFGTDQNINWMLQQQYQILGKVYSHTRVTKLRQSLGEWLPTPSSAGREVALVTPPHRYARRTRQMIVKTPKKAPSKGWEYGALVTTLSEYSVQEVVDLYDDRGGGIETDFRSDRQGLGIAKRQKHGMAAQQMLIHLAERAHNCLVWTAQQLGAPFSQYGMLRLVRDVLQVDGYLIIDQGQPCEIGLNRYHPLAYTLQSRFNRLFLGHPAITLWEPEEPAPSN